MSTPARRLSPLTPLVRAPLLVVAFVGATWRELLDDGLGRLSIIFVALLGAGALYGAISWLRTMYRIDELELRIDTGVVVRQSRRIRIDRLQGIDIVQPFVARILGLAELRFDVAAGGESEGRLAFLSLTQARDLRAVLLQRRDNARQDRATDAETEVSAHPAARLVAELSLGRLVGSVLASWEFGFLLIGAAMLVPISLLTGAPLLAGGFLPAMAGAGFAAWSKLAGYWNFRLSESTQGLAIERGLMSRSAQTLPRERIQGIVVRESVLWRPFGWARLDVSVAGGSADASADALTGSVLMPVASRAEILALVHWALADHLDAGGSIETIDLSAPPGRARWLAPLTSRYLAIGFDDRLVMSRRGWITRRLDVAPLARVQSVRISQGLLSRLFALGELHIDSPPGPVRVRASHRDPVELRAMANQVTVASRQARQRLSLPW